MHASEEKQPTPGKKIGVILLALKNNRPQADVKRSIDGYLQSPHGLQQTGSHFMIVSPSQILIQNYQQGRHLAKAA